MVKKQSFTLPKNLTAEIINELTKLAGEKDTQAVCLNFLNRLPLDLQPKFLEHLSSLNNPNLMPFFRLVVQEGCPELAQLANKALKKLSFLGLTLKDDNINMKNKEFYKAWISNTRVMSNCNLVIVWEKDEGIYELHDINLSFGFEGIKDFKIKRNISTFELACEQVNLSAYKEITFNIAVSVLLDAYQINLKYNKLNFSEKDLKNYDIFFKNIDEKEKEEYNKEIVSQLNIKQLINIYLSAIKKLDSYLLYDLATEFFQKKLIHRNDITYPIFYQLLNKTFIKTSVELVKEDSKRTWAEATIIVINENDELEKYLLGFELANTNQEYYHVNNCQLKTYEILDYDSKENPFNYHVYCQLYEVKEGKAIREWLESQPEITVTGEFEEGVCYKWFKQPKSLLEGIDITDAIIGEFIITPYEFMVFTKELHDLGNICNIIEKKLNNNEIIYISKYYSPVKEIYKVFTNSQSRLTELIESKDIVKEKKAIIKIEENINIKQYCEECSYYKINYGPDTFFYYKKKENEENKDYCCEDITEYQIRPNWFSVSAFDNELIFQCLLDLNINHEDVVFLDEIESLQKGEIPSLFLNNLENRAWHLLKFLHLVSKENELQKSLGLNCNPQQIANRIGVLIS